MNPPIEYRQKAFTRSQLVDMRRTLLEKCEQMIANTNWPYLLKNLRTQKIFNDLHQYYMNEGPNSSLIGQRVGSLPSLNNLNE